MTVDEAIICLSDMKIKVAIPKAAVQARLNNEALDMAIEALKCSEFPNNSDTISKQAVTKFLNDWLSCLFENCHKQSASDLKMIIKDFKNLPSAQPERKTGRWIEMSSTNHTYKCSVCGRLLVNITDGKNKVAKNYPYCHCGADMRGEQE